MLCKMCVLICTSARVVSSGKVMSDEYRSHGDQATNY